MTCEACGGTGWDDTSDDVCFLCNGSGWIDEDDEACDE